MKLPPWLLIPWLVSCGWGVGLSHVWGQAEIPRSSPGTAEADLSQEQSAEIAKLVDGLGSKQFQIREGATRQLLALGESALPSLRGLAGTASFEVRQRAHLIRQRIEDEKFAQLSRSFLLDLDDHKSYGLPAWEQYRELVGGSRTSKLLFLDMVREQPELVRLIDAAGRPEATPATLQALAVLGAAEAARLRQDFLAIRDPQLGNAVAMLMTAATLPQQTPVQISDIIVSYERPGFGGHLNDAGYGACLRKLLAAWLPKTHPSLAPIAMECALNNDLSEGVEIARRHLTKNFDADTRKLALYCLARFGSETDIQRLLPLMTDQQIVDEFARSAIEGDIHVSEATPPGLLPRESALSNNLVVRINDLAMVTAMLLHHDDPALIYPRFESHAKLGFFIHSLAASPEAAEPQQALINQWVKQHLGQAVGS